MSEEQQNAIVQTSSMTLIEPAANVEELKKHWQTIQELKKSILDKSDIQEIQGKAYVKRSGWRKLQSAFAISDRIISKEREEQPDGNFLWRVTVEAYHAKTGRAAIGIGTCSTRERKFSHPDHDVLATAHTRAKNRAISDLIGLGEVSAEELQDEDQQANTVVLQPQPQQQPVELCRCGHQKRLHIDNVCMIATKEGRACVCT